MKLFCFAHAGSSANVYNCWKVLLEPAITIVPVELPGRGRRFGDPLCREFHPLLEDLYTQLRPETEKGEYAFFGHSMGTMLCFKLAQLLVNRQARKPRHLFLSGKSAPHCKTRILDPDLGDEELIARIEKLGGTSPEIFRNAELKEIFLPILRADLSLLSTYRPESEPQPLDLDCTLMYGQDDPLLLTEELEAWGEYIKRPFKQHVFPGGHMYLYPHQEGVTRIIKKTLLPEKATSFGGGHS